MIYTFVPTPGGIPVKASHYHEFGLFDPEEQTSRGNPTLLKLIGVELDRPFPEILGAPDADAAMRSSIVRILDDREQKQRTAGSPYLARSRCCARCGGALGLSRCTSCGLTFRDDGVSYADGISLPPSLHNHLL